MKNTLFILLICGSILASDPEADALAVAGASAASKGKIDVAEGLLYRALIKDQNCATALYELGKIEHGRKTSLAFDFLRKSIPALESEGKSTAAADAKRRLYSDPVSAALQSAFDEYKNELKKISAKCDQMTAEEINSRSEAMNLGLSVESTVLDYSNFPWGKLDAKLWDSIQAPQFKVMAASVFDTKMDVLNGQKYLIIPNPTDTWDTCKGSKDWGGKFNFMGLEGTRKYERAEMIYRVVNGQDSGQKNSCKTVVSGAGRIKIGIAKEAQYGENDGFIRVKIVRIK